ncbi:MAG: flagellar export chaperone FliS [Epsilonproteobacteria bacterium]|nr:flagellar export chaperone FliS [Campylobacterota bacterium]
MSNNTLAYNAYTQNHLGVTSTEKLIEMLYEGLLKFCALAKKAIEKEDVEEKAKYINKAINIFVELINDLDYEKGGDIAHYLSGLYTHQIKLLSLANINNSTQEIDTVINVVKVLLETWREETKIGAMAK